MQMLVRKGKEKTKGEETVVFLLAETDGVAEHRRIEFGISPAFVSSFFTHITLDLAV